jgi:hypothetical protein
MREDRKHEAVTPIGNVVRFHSPHNLHSSAVHSSDCKATDGVEGGDSVLSGLAALAL